MLVLHVHCRFEKFSTLYVFSLYKTETRWILVCNFYFSYSTRAIPDRTDSGSHMNIQYITLLAIMRVKGICMDEKDMLTSS